MPSPYNVLWHIKVKHKNNYIRNYLYEILNRWVLIEHFEYGDRACSVAGLREWYDLPSDNPECRTVESLKISLCVQISILSTLKQNNNPNPGFNFVLTKYVKTDARSGSSCPIRILHNLPFCILKIIKTFYKYSCELIYYL